MSDNAVLQFEDLDIETSQQGALVLDGVHLSIGRGKVTAIVGESGSGKTTLALAALGYIRPGLVRAGGSVIFDGHDLLSYDESQLQRLRGRRLTYVPQDPGSALSPGIPVGRQVREVLEVHGSDTDIDAAVERAWRAAHLPSDGGFMSRYPHQLSGGQQQRVAIAMALVGGPELLVMDEPTTGLDVVTQAGILATVRDAITSLGTSVIYVSHDLAVVRSLVDNVAVMYAGQVVETGVAEQVFTDPAHPYSRRLLAAVPRFRGEVIKLRGLAGAPVAVDARPPGCQFAPRCPDSSDECKVVAPELVQLAGAHAARCIKLGTPDLGRVRAAVPVLRSSTSSSLALRVVRCTTGYATARRRSRDVLHNVSLDLPEASIVALVGQSGSGKTTLGRCIAGLHPGVTGSLEIGGESSHWDAQKRTDAHRKAVQMVFQNPDSSLNPMLTVEESIARPLRFFFGAPKSQCSARVAELLEAVQLDASKAASYPSQLSGGERQRVAIARALAAEPSVVVCDEITSSLDVIVQAGILELLGRLRDERRLAMLFISHDLAVVRALADRVAILDQGVVVEDGEVDAVCDRPSSDASSRLMDAVFDLGPDDYPRSGGR